MDEKALKNNLERIFKPENYCFREWRVPDYMRPGIERHIESGIKCGEFLTAVLSCDMQTAFYKADDNNMGQMPAYMSFMYNWAPLSAWGSEENVEAWRKRGGLRGIAAADAKPQKEKKTDEEGA